MIVRETQAKDIPGIQRVLDETGLFPSEMLPDLLSGFLSAAYSEDVWLSCEAGGDVTGFCYAAPEALTDGTWNMLAIAVLPAAQGKGTGAAIVAELESQLLKDGHRVLIADTSGSAEFEQTRKFYRKNGYTEEARIRDFWSAGDDKVVFWKAIS